VNNWLGSAWITAVHNRQWPHHVWITHVFTHSSPRRTIISGLIMYEMQLHTWSTAAHYHKWPHHACNTTACISAGTIYMTRFPLCSDTHTCTTCHAFRCAATLTRAQRTTRTYHDQATESAPSYPATAPTGCTVQYHIMYGKLQHIVHGTRHSVLIVVTQRTTLTRRRHTNSFCWSNCCVASSRSLSSPCPSTRLSGDSVEAANVWLLNVSTSICTLSTRTTITSHVLPQAWRTSFAFVKGRASNTSRNIFVNLFELHDPRPCRRTPVSTRWSDQALSTPRAVTPVIAASRIV
jgi:hypothetical protein